jgi:predicted RND superfamily exporter protein
VAISEEEKTQAATMIQKDRVAAGDLVSDDGKAFAINVFLDRDVNAGRDQIVEEIIEITKGLDVAVSGVPVFRTMVNTRTRVELAMFVPFVLFLIGLVIYLSFGTLRAVLLALASAAIGTWVSLGAMGATGTPISLSTITLPPVMLAIGCAYVVHILCASAGIRRRSDLEECLKKIARPVALSGLTTAIGFLAMSTVQITAIRELGTFGSLGVIIVLAAALTLSPAVLVNRPVGHRATAVRMWVERTLRARLLKCSLESGVWVIGVALLLGVVCAVGVGRVNIDTDIIRWFPRGGEIRDSYELIRERFSGITPMNVVIESLPGRSVTDPEAVDAIDDLGVFLEGMPEIGRSVSFVQPLRQLHSVFQGGEGGDLPNSRELSEQYLTILGSLEQVHDLISDDREAANVLIRADVNGSSQLMSVASRIGAWWDEREIEEYSITVTGIMYEFGRAEEAIAYGQVRGLSLAFLAVAIVLMLALGSLRASMLALVPNILPLVMTFGCMGFLDIPLDAATVCVACIALGIAVDDTIHIAVGYREELARQRERREALNAVMSRVLFPLIVTTLAIVSGFFVLGLSEFTLIRNFGLVTGSVVALCLIADLTVLPVLLRWSVRERGGISDSGWFRVER